jgi:methionyl-tRNA formyltransferase
MKSKVKSEKLKVIFMGTSEFAIPILKSLLRTKGYGLCAIITQPDKKTGRGQKLTPPPVKVTGQKYKIPVYQPKNLSALKSQISNLNPHLVIVAAYGQILSKEILQIPQYGCLNIHPSLLPKYRGPSPIQATILNAEIKTGVTIIKMNEKMDTGNIIAQKKIDINAEDEAESLTSKLSQEGASLLVETLPKYLSGKIKLKPQIKSQATYTKIIKKEDGHINWNNSAELIERHIRAYYRWPGSYTYWSYKIRDMRYEKMIKILEVKVSKLKTQISKLDVGTVFLTSKKELAVACGKDYLIIKKLQLEGKKAMPAWEFLKGHKDIIGNILK